MRWDPIPILLARVELLSVGGGKEREIKLSTRPRPQLRLCTLAVLSVGLLFAPGAAPATAAGSPVAWGCGGRTDFGQCDVPSGLSAVTAISADLYHSLALKGDGTVVAWGCASGDAGQCSVPSGLSGVTAIAAGVFHSLAVKGDGTVVAWGCVGSDYGQCSVPSGLSGVTAVAAGGAHSLALGEPMTPAPCRVPKVVGKRVASAKRTIAKRHCRTGRVGHAYSRTRTKGIVISQSRRPGRVLPARSKINLIVSRGRRR